MIKRFGKVFSICVILVLVVAPFVIDFMFITNSGAGGQAASRADYIYVLNPGMVLSQAFPCVDVEIINPTYAFASLSPRKTVPAVGQLWKWQVVSVAVYAAFALFLVGLILYMRRRIIEKLPE